MPVFRIPPYYDFTQSTSPVTFTIPTYLGGNGYPYLIGSRYADKLTGSSGTDQIDGWFGNDQIYGGGGNDILSGGDGYDLIYGGEGSDLVFGGNQDDTIYGENGDDALNGDAGNDTVYGGNGRDYLFGGAGMDMLSGDADADYLDAGADDDTLYGGDGDDLLLGADGWDNLSGGAGNDYLDGGTGYNWLSGGAGADLFNGGVGIDEIRGDDTQLYPWFVTNSADTVRYLNSSAGVTITLTTVSYWQQYQDPFTGNYRTFYVIEGRGSGTTGDAAGDTYYSIENIEASRFDDVITGNSFDNTFLGFDGNDRLDGGDGADTLHGGFGDDTVYGGNGNDVLRGGGILTRDVTMRSLPTWPVNPPSTLAPNISDISNVDIRQWMHEDGNDYLNGGAGDDQIFGGSGDDTLIGGNGLNHMYGGDGNDFIVAGKDADVIDGDERYESLPSGSLNVTGWAEFNALASDAFGSDTVSYAGSETGVTVIFSEYFTDFNINVDLGGGLMAYTWLATIRTTATGVGGNAAGDTLFSIENVIGGGGNDTIVGTANVANRFEGGSGNDLLDGGGGGRDTLIGGGGYDTMSGGTGVDTYIYNGVYDAQASITYAGGAIPIGTAVDSIRKFTSGQDIIDLRLVDAVEQSWWQDDAFTVVGGFSGRAGELLIQDFAANAAGGASYAVAGDTNGDGRADFLIQVDTTLASKLTATDFLL